MSQAEATRRQIADLEARIAERTAQGKTSRNLEDLVATRRVELRFFEAETAAEISALRDIPGVAVSHPPTIAEPISPGITAVNAYAGGRVDTSTVSRAGPQRDPYSMPGIDPRYAEQIELRQEVQTLGRAVQARPESEVSRERLEEKYAEYIDVRRERGAVMPSAEIQARAVDPRSAADLLAEQPVVPRPGLELKLSGAIRGILFLSVLAWTIGAAKGK